MVQPKAACPTERLQKFLKGSEFNSGLGPGKGHRPCPACAQVHLAKATVPFVSNSGLAVYIRQQPKRDPARKIASALLSVYGGWV